MDKSDFVIIGGVAAGPKTAAVLARRLPEAKITIFQKEEHISYGVCGLPLFASGDINSFDELAKTSYGLIRTPEFFKNSKGVNVITSHEVISIDRDARTITVKNLKNDETFEHGYDKLVIATGARPVSPKYPMADCPNIRHFTRPDDAIYFRQMAQQGKVGSAVIIGGGFIGCELAEAAASLWGIEVTLIEKENQLLPYVLDPEMAMIVRKEMIKQDVTVLTGCEVENIDINSDGNPVVNIKGQDSITTDYVFICQGVRAEISLAKSCGLKIGRTGAISVNRQMQTSDVNIFAGGDCVESNHRINNEPIYIREGSLANRHGWVIAENLAGNKAEFPGVVGSFFIKVFDLNVGSVGLSEKAANKSGMKSRAIWGSFADKPDYHPEKKTFTLKMVYSDNDYRLLGLQAIGQGEICRRIDVFSSFLQNKATVKNLLDFEQGYAPPYSDAIDPLFHMATMAIAQSKGINFINPGTDFKSLNDELLWLDVRETEEAESEPWPLADKNNYISIPSNELINRLNEIERDKKIMIICKRGPRAYQTSLILKHAGFKDVNIIAGGVMALA